MRDVLCWMGAVRVSIYGVASAVTGHAPGGCEITLLKCFDRLSSAVTTSSSRSGWQVRHEPREA